MADLTSFSPQGHEETWSRDRRPESGRSPVRKCSTEYRKIQYLSRICNTYHKKPEQTIAENRLETVHWDGEMEDLKGLDQVFLVCKSASHLPVVCMSFGS